MKKPSQDKRRSEHSMRPEYDFSKAVRGRYASRYAAGTNIIVLDPDVAREFPTSDVVNETLRQVTKLLRSRKTRNGKRRTA